MPTWLTVADLWRDLEAPGDVPDDQSDQYQRLSDALNAAMELVEVRTGTDWGAADELPATIKKATLLQANRLFKRASAPFGIAAIGSIDGTQGMRLSARLDPDVELLLADYRSFASL